MWESTQTSFLGHHPDVSRPVLPGNPSTKFSPSLSVRVHRIYLDLGHGHFSLPIVGPYEICLRIAFDHGTWSCPKTSSYAYLEEPSSLDNDEIQAKGAGSLCIWF